MDIIFTKHAKVRMSQREITEGEIKSLIENPEVTKETFKERIIARKKFSRGILEVVYRRSKDKLVVITCYWTKEG